MSRLTKRIGGNAVSDYSNKQILEHLAYLEDKQEQGLLIELKIPFGTKIYYVDEQSTEVEEYTVNGIVGTRYVVEEPKRIEKNADYLCSFSEIDIGKTVFLTRSEAEEALAKIEKQKERYNE